MGWERVNSSAHTSKDVFFKAFLPMLIILALTAFVPMCFDHTLNTHTVLIHAITQASVFFILYFLTSYVLGEMFRETVKTKAGDERVNIYVLYNLMYLMLLNIISNLMPIDFTPVLFMMLYVLWIAVKGVPFIEVKEGKETKFVVIAVAMMLLAPIVINFLKL